MEEDIKEILTALDNTTKKQLDEAIANADKEWSKMKLEENIKILEEMIENHKEYFLGNYELIDDMTITLKDIEAIENLIQRNKELEEDNKILLHKVNELTQENIKICDTVNQDFITKSKVKEKIEELEKEIEEKQENRTSELEEINEEHQKLNGKLQDKITRLEIKNEVLIEIIEGKTIRELGTSNLYKEETKDECSRNI